MYYTLFLWCIAQFVVYHCNKILVVVAYMGEIIQVVHGQVHLTCIMSVCHIQNLNVDIYSGMTDGHGQILVAGASKAEILSCFPHFQCA